MCSSRSAARVVGQLRRFIEMSRRPMRERRMNLPARSSGIDVAVQWVGVGVHPGIGRTSIASGLRY